MERKIGEIFEYNGEWLQCVEQPKKYDKTVCSICAFQGNGNCELDRCSGTYRSDKKFVIFKKLEKVGEPFSDEHFGLVQKYELKMYGYSTKDKRVCFADGYDVFIKIKKNKEDMEEKKLNLKPFDIQKAKAGKPVCTRDGRKARIICFDAKGSMYPIIALIEESGGEKLCPYMPNGRSYKNEKECIDNLMMLPEKKEGWAKVRKDINLYDTKEEADRKMIGNDEYVTAKVCWEE